MADKIEVRPPSSGLYFYRAIVVVAWVIGVVLAQGFWQTFFTVVFPPYAWYVAAERFLQHFSIL